MHASIRTVLAAVAALACAAPPLPAPAAKAFAGPTGWDHTVASAPTAQNPRAQETWKKSEGELITVLSDAGMNYDDIVALVKKNVADNGLKPAMDRDRSCNGHRAHEIEMTFGATVVHQLIVDDAPGATKVTYSRPQGAAFAADVATATIAYCGGA